MIQSVTHRGDRTLLPYARRHARACPIDAGKGGLSEGFGIAPMITSHSMNRGSPSVNGINHRDTALSNCGRTKDVRLLILHT